MSNKFLLAIYGANLVICLATLIGAHGDAATAWMMATFGWFSALLCRAEIMLVGEEA